MEESQKGRQICLVQLSMRRKRSYATPAVGQLLVPQILDFVHNNRVLEHQLNKLGFFPGAESVELLAVHQFKIRNRILVELADGRLDFANHCIHLAQVPVVADLDVEERLKIVHDDRTRFALLVNSVHLDEELLLVATFLFLFFVVA